MVAPAIAAMRGLQTPQAMMAWSTSMVPRVVSTVRIRGRPNGTGSTSRPVTSVSSRTVSTPLARARSRMIVPAPTESTTETLGV